VNLVRQIFTDTDSHLLPPTVWRDSEVVFWFSAILAKCRPGSSEVAAVIGAVLALNSIDGAPADWRALLWSSMCTLASMATSDQCPGILEWMLQRSPMQDGCTVELTELPYAKAIEAVCQQLFQNGGAPANLQVAEKLAALALANEYTFHPDTAKARGCFLNAMRFTMNGDSMLMCQGLAKDALPQLRRAAELEAEQAVGTNDFPWHATQTLFLALGSVLPVLQDEGGFVKEASHPAVALWREYWPTAEAALLSWPLCAATEQPVAGAAEAMKKVATCIPILLLEALHLICRSMQHRELPDSQLKSMQEIIQNFPCPPVDACKTAELLSSAIGQITNNLLNAGAGLMASPDTVASFFRLLSESLSPAHCGSQLRTLILSESQFVVRAIAFTNDILPTCSSNGAVEAMLSFLSGLVVAPELQQPHCKDAFVSAMPCLCQTLCRTLAAPGTLSSARAMSSMASVLGGMADSCPNEFPVAIQAGLDCIEVPDWSRERLRQHLDSRSSCASKDAWVCQLRQITHEWQSEGRRRLLLG